MGKVLEGGSGYRELADVVADPTWAYDLDAARLIFVAGCTSEISGHSCGEIVTAFASNALPQVRRHFARALPRRIADFRRGIVATFTDELRVPRKGGGEVGVAIRSRLVRHDATGHLVLCGSARALTRWTKEVARIHDLPEDPEPSAAAIENELAAQRAKLRTLLDTIPDIVFVKDLAGRFFECNRKFERLVGRPQAEVIGKTDYDFSPKEVADFFRERDRIAIERGESTTNEEALLYADGYREIVEMSKTPVRDGDGRIIGILGVGRDITAAREATEALRASEERYRALVENMDDVVFSVDADGRVLFANGAIARFGYVPEAMIGRRFAEFLHPDDASTLAAWLDAPGHPTQDIPHPAVEIRLRDAQGEHRAQRARGRTVIANGEVVGVTGVLVDLSLLRETEQQLRAAQRMEAIGRLAGGVAHDFNNLLTVIMTCAIVVLDALPESASELREDLDQIVAAGQRAEALTRQLLAFSRRQVLQPASLHLHTVVDQLAVMLRRLIGEDIDLRLRTSKVAPTMVDRGQIEQVVMNLVVNARDAMPKGGVITIATKNVLLEDTRARSLELAPGWYVEISVQDTGIGMDPATMARIFEPFFSTKEPGKGTGLGLSMAYGIVKQSGGSIAVESRRGHGARFSVYFPRDPASELDTSEAPAGPSSAQPLARSGHETILVVEDDENVRSVVRRILKNAGYDVILAADGVEALAIAEEKSRAIALVLSDVVMPKMSGSTLVERLTAAHPWMKVMFTSGYTDDKIAREGVRGHRFLAKPFRPDQLTSAVREVLDGVVAPDE